MGASKVQGITPFIVMGVLVRAEILEKQGVHIIYLEVGEPDFDILILKAFRIDSSG